MEALGGVKRPVRLKLDDADLAVELQWRLTGQQRCVRIVTAATTRA